jgi:predicted XRE-type DNA-binding protein
MTDLRFESVWDALEDTPAEAANMRARSEFLVAIQAAAEGWGLTQREAAERLGVTQPRMNDLLKGRIDRFSLDALMNLAHAAGLVVEWNLRRSAA